MLRVRVALRMSDCGRRNCNRQARSVPPHQTTPRRALTESRRGHFFGNLCGVVTPFAFCDRLRFVTEWRREAQRLEKRNETSETHVSSWRPRSTLCVAVEREEAKRIWSCSDANVVAFGYAPWLATSSQDLDSRN